MLDTGRSTAFGLLPENAPRPQVWLVRAATLESFAATLAALTGHGPLVPDVWLWLPSPALLLETCVLALFVGWPFLAEKKGWWG